MTGTGLSGLAKDGLVYAHRGEIILTPQESDVFRDTARGLDPMTFLKKIQPLRLAESGSSSLITSTNTNNTKKVENHYSIFVNPSSIGGKQFQSAQEAAEATVREINARSTRLGMN